MRSKCKIYSMNKMRKINITKIEEYESNKFNGDVLSTNINDYFNKIPIYSNWI